MVAVKAAVGASVLGRYGWHRDELYYAVAGRHLALGYVDFPPVTALLAAADRAVLGDSVVALRALALAAGGAVVVVCALIARDLGGGRRAQLVAAVGAAISPFLVGENQLFQPVSFDVLASVLVLWIAVRLALAPSRRLWLALGVVLGVGLETKYTLAVLALGLLLGFALSRRALLRPADVALAAGIALLLLAPNLVWQAGHHWASARFFANPGPSATGESRPQYVLDLLLMGGITTAPLWIAGFVRLRRDPRTRGLAWAVLAVAVAYLALGGKSYYAAPALLVLVAAGAISFDGWARSRLRVAAPAAVVGAVTLAVLPLGVPVLGAGTMARHGLAKMRADYADELGWPNLVDAVARAAARTHASAVVAANYGEAGALDVLGRGRGLPPTVSGHMSYRYWRPARLASAHVVVVGYDASFVAGICTRHALLATVRIPYGVDNEENGAAVVACDLRGGLDGVWPRLVHPRLGGA